MSKKEYSYLLMLCGALQDISECCKDKWAAEKVKEVQVKLESLVSKEATKLINEPIVLV